MAVGMKASFISLCRHFGLKIRFEKVEVEESIIVRITSDTLYYVLVRKKK